jgi:hypothetical protein
VPTIGLRNANAGVKAGGHAQIIHGRVGATAKKSADHFIYFQRQGVPNYQVAAKPDWTIAQHLRELRRANVSAYNALLETPDDGEVLSFNAKLTNGDYTTVDLENSDKATVGTYLEDENVPSPLTFFIEAKAKVVPKRGPVDI